MTYQLYLRCWPKSKHWTPNFHSLDGSRLPGVSDGQTKLLATWRDWRERSFSLPDLRQAYLDQGGDEKQASRLVLARASSADLFPAAFLGICDREPPPMLGKIAVYHRCSQGHYTAGGRCLKCGRWVAGWRRAVARWCEGKDIFGPGEDGLIFEGEANQLPHYFWRDEDEVLARRQGEW